MLTFRWQNNWKFEFRSQCHIACVFMHWQRRIKQTCWWNWLENLFWPTTKYTQGNSGGTNSLSIMVSGFLSLFIFLGRRHEALALKLNDTSAPPATWYCSDWFLSLVFDPFNPSWRAGANHQIIFWGPWTYVKNMFICWFGFKRLFVYTCNYCFCLIF